MVSVTPALASSQQNGSHAKTNKRWSLSYSCFLVDLLDVDSLNFAKLLFPVLTQPLPATAQKSSQSGCIKWTFVLGFYATISRKIDNVNKQL